MTCIIFASGIILPRTIVESKEYFEKVMQDYNQHRNVRNLRKNCKDEAIDYYWVMEYRKTYPNRKEDQAQTEPPFHATGHIREYDVFYMECRAIGVDYSRRSQFGA